MFETRNSYLAVDNWCYWGLWGRYAGNTIITLKQKLNIWGHATFMPFFLERMNSSPTKRIGRTLI